MADVYIYNITQVVSPGATDRVIGWSVVNSRAEAWDIGRMLTMWRASSVSLAGADVTSATMGGLTGRSVAARLDPVWWGPLRQSAPSVASDGAWMIADGRSYNPAFGGPAAYARVDEAWQRLLDMRVLGWSPYVQVTSPSWTTTAAYLGCEIQMSGSSPKTVTVAAVDAVPGLSGAPGSQITTTGPWAQLRVAALMVLRQVGSGTITVAQGSGVTIAGSLATAGPESLMVLEWSGAGTVRTRTI